MRARGRFSLPANTSGDGLPSSVNARGSATPAGQRSGASVAAAASTLPAPRRASAGSVTACASSAPAGYSSAPWASCTAAARMVPAGSVSGCARVPATGNTVPAANCVCDNGSSKLSMAPDGNVVPCASDTPISGTTRSPRYGCTPDNSSQPESSGVTGGGAKPSLMLPLISRLPPARIARLPTSPDP